jgi:hypothetical protein
MNDKNSSIRSVAFAPNKMTSLQVVDNHGDIAAGSQYFLPEIPLGKGAQVINRFKYSKLADGQSNG